VGNRSTCMLQGDGSPPGKTTEYTVSEAKDFGSSVTITNSDDQTSASSIRDSLTSPAIKRR